MRPNKKVLVVDDNPVNLGILEEMLSGDYHLSFARSGEEAVRTANRIRPAVILLDVMMPGMDGLETCYRLRQSVHLGETAIVMVSAKALPSEQAAGMEAGANDYLTKPFDEVDLLVLLNQLTSPTAVRDSRRAVGG
jgi:putative two-component system response regulator